MKKRLYRSEKSKMIAGICGGIGEYFDIDPAIVRIVAVVLAFANGIGLIAYIAAWIIIPRVPEGVVVESDESREPSELRKYIPGLLLIVVGLVFLFDKAFWWFNWGVFWPVILIAIGAGLIWRSTTHKEEQAEGGAHESVEN